MKLEYANRKSTVYRQQEELTERNVPQTVSFTGNSFKSKSEAWILMFHSCKKQISRLKQHVQE